MNPDETRIRQLFDLLPENRPAPSLDDSLIVRTHRRPRRSHLIALIPVAVLAGLLAAGFSFRARLDAETVAVQPPTPAPMELPVARELDSQPAGAAGCKPASPGLDSQYKGTSDTLEGHLLVISPKGLVADQNLSLIWRITGTGELLVEAVPPRGGEAVRLSDLEQRFGSNFNRPGDEWATRFEFPEPGCWELRLRRTDGTVTFWLDIQ
jgi:hypothetical protein